MSKGNLLNKAFVLVGIGGLAYGIYHYYMMQYKILENWGYRVIGGKLINADLQNIEIQVDVEVTNDSSVTLTITDYYFNIYLEGVRVGYVSNASVNQILNKDGGKSYFPVMIKLDTKQFLRGEIITGLAESVKNAKLRMVGYFGVKKGILKFKNIPFDYTYKLKEFM
jgi:LEA14-like dessication related protein